MSDGLKVENRTGQLFYDSPWIAGVLDYDGEEFDDQFFEDYMDEDILSKRDNDELPEDQFREIDPDKMTDVDDPQVGNSDDDNDENPGRDGGNVNIEAVDAAKDSGDEAEVANKNDEADGEPNPSTEDEDGDADLEEVRITRLGIMSRSPVELMPVQEIICTLKHIMVKRSYLTESARVIAMTICQVNDMFVSLHIMKQSNAICTNLTAL